ncbi:hypothetical protein QOT17_023717 [Balamuthia mandrillaris]
MKTEGAGLSVLTGTHQTLRTMARQLEALHQALKAVEQKRCSQSQSQEVDEDEEKNDVETTINDFHLLLRSELAELLHQAKRSEALLQSVVVECEAVPTTKEVHFEDEDTSEKKRRKEPHQDGSMELVSLAESAFDFGGRRAKEEHRQKVLRYLSVTSHQEQEQPTQPLGDGRGEGERDAGQELLSLYGGNYLLEIDEVRLAKEYVIQQQQERLQELEAAFAFLWNENVGLQHAAHRYKTQLFFVAEKIELLEQQNLRNQNMQVQLYMEMQSQLQDAIRNVASTQGEGEDNNKGSRKGRSLSDEEREELVTHMKKLREEISAHKRSFDRKLKEQSNEYQFQIELINKKRKAEVEKLRKKLEQTRLENESLQKQLHQQHKSAELAQRKALVADIRPPRSALSEFVRPSRSATSSPAPPSAQHRRSVPSSPLSSSSSGSDALWKAAALSKGGDHTIRGRSRSSPSVQRIARGTTPSANGTPLTRTPKH